MGASDKKTLEARLRAFAKPIAKKVFYGQAVQPGPGTRWIYRAVANADYYVREAYELVRRSLVATPAFLTQCESYGDRIEIDRLPYIQGSPRIILGSDIRFSGQVGIQGNAQRNPLLRLGNGIFIGHGTTFVIADRIEIGDFVSIGGGSYITDTDGHANYNPNRPIWEVPATESEIAPVIIEDNVQISRDVTILRGVRIGARAIIGAGSVVRTDIPPDSVVAGNPARVVKRMVPTTPADAGTSAGAGASAGAGSGASAPVGAAPASPPKSDAT